jgi:hypothetical protein
MNGVIISASSGPGLKSDIAAMMSSKRLALQPRREVALPAALELEHPDRVRARDRLVDARVVGARSNGSGTASSPSRSRASSTALGDRRVHPQAQDVHLHEAERLDVVLVVLRDHHALGRPLQRRPGVDGLARDDEAAEVGAEMHRTGVELLGDLEDGLVTRLRRADGRDTRGRSPAPRGSWRALTQGRWRESAFTSSIPVRSARAMRTAERAVIVLTVATIATCSLPNRR